MRVAVASEEPMQTPSQLRPMSVGDILDAAFRLYRANFLPLLGISALLQVPVAIIQFVVQGLFVGVLVRLTELQTAPVPPSGNPFEQFPLAEMAVFYILLLGVGLLQYLVVQNLIAAAVISAGERARAGAPVTILEAYRLGAPRFGALLLSALALMGIGVLAGVLFFACFVGAAAAAGAVLASQLDPVMIGLVVGVVMLGIAVLFAPLALFFYTRFALVAPAIVLERAGPIAGLRRSWSLTGRAFWKSLLIVILLGLLFYGIVSIPSQTASTVVTLAAGGSPNSLALSTGVATLLAYLGIILVQPLQLLGHMFQYYDLRVRAEGYDLELRAGELAS
jgi:hypothetical protein